jgi:stage II sporulation protein P
MYSAPISSYGRYRKLYPGRRLITGLALMIITIFLVVKTAPVFWEQFSPLNTLKAVPFKILAVYQLEPEKVLKSAIPVLRWGSFEGDGDSPSMTQVFLYMTGTAGRVNLLSPAAVLQSQIPLLAALEWPDALPASSPDYNAPAKTTAGLLAEGLVAVYNTHAGETYSLTDGVERLDGRRGGVVTVAAAFQETLEIEYGIKVARSDRINDLSYNTSYLESEKTARELLAANPKTWAVFDIHRDSGKTREQSVVKINGQNVAPILLIVGSDARRSFPAWRQNHAFAVDLSDKLNEKYPGLSLGVRVKDGLYNQSLHPHAVLLEIGTTKNSTDEAVRSARLLADVVAGMINGEELKN